ESRDGRTVRPPTHWLPEGALSIHPEKTAEQDLYTAVGKARGNREAGRRRDAKASHPNYARSISPATGDAGSAAAVEPNVFRSQLRFSTGTIRASSSNPSTAVPCGRLRLGDRSRLGEIFRSSQSRQIDGADRETCRGQAAVKTHPGVLERRGDGERVSQSKRGRDSARGPTFATAQ